MRLRENPAGLDPQVREIVENALDKREYVDVTSHAVADTEFSVAHGLRYVPSGYVVIKRDKSAVVYNGTTAWTSNLIYLKASAATVALRLLIF